MNNVEVVTVVAGGMLYSGFEEAHVSAAIDEAARTFQIRTTESPGEFRFPPGTPLQVYANGDLCVDGYVNLYSPSGDATTHSIAIQGRGKGQDFVDCAPDHPTGTWLDKTPEQIAKEIDQWGVGVRAEIPLPTEEYWKREPGETSFETMERLLRGHGATMMGNADGSISITNASVARRHAGALIEGINIKRYQGSLSDDKRFDGVFVKGQNRNGKGRENLRIRKNAKGGGRAGRRKEMLDERATTEDKAQKRADHEAERGEGLSIKARITVQGWRDDAGELWTPNRLIFVDSPVLLHLVQDMLIEKIDMRQGRDGSLTELQLVDPRTYKGKGSGGGKAGGGKTDKAWGYL